MSTENPLGPSNMIVWQHPVQMIMAAESIRGCRYDYCVECNHFRPISVWSQDDPTPITVTVNRELVVLRWYRFGWEDQLGWNSFIKMGLCMCGTLYVCMPTLRQVVIDRDVYGPGHHEYKFEPEEFKP